MVGNINSTQDGGSAEKNGSDDDVKKKGISLIIHDLKQKKLIPIKVLNFVVVTGKHCRIT